MDWADVVPTALDYSSRIAERVPRLREAAHSFVEEKSASYFWDPQTDRIGVSAAVNADWDFLFKAASVFGPVREIPIADEELNAPDCALVKVGYSQALRSLGEGLNFFEGTYPGGIPNHPSPLAATLTSGLVGAGLGWGTGKLFEKILPQGYGRNLGRTGAILGGLGGGSLGAAWGVSNLARGKPLNDSSLFNGSTEPSINPSLLDGSTAPGEPFPAFQDYLRNVSPFFSRDREKTSADALAFVELSETCQASIEDFVKRAYSTYGVAPERRQATPADVNIGALGQTLWDVAAPPPLTAATMGAMYAASQFPDPRGKPGWATMNQLGQLAERSGNSFGQGALVGLATNAISDYLTGTLGGVALNSLVGTPYAARTFGAVNAGLGVLGRVIGSLWG